VPASLRIRAIPLRAAAAVADRDGRGEIVVLFRFS
jgi:hypothetical protein